MRFVVCPCGQGFLPAYEAGQEVSGALLLRVGMAGRGAGGLHPGPAACCRDLAANTFFHNANLLPHRDGSRSFSFGFAFEPSDDDRRVGAESPYLRPMAGLDGTGSGLSDFTRYFSGGLFCVHEGETRFCGCHLIVSP